jgi:acyl carrier protein
MVHELEATIIVIVAKLLKRPADTLHAQTSFAAAGLESISAIRLIAELEARLGRDIDPTLILDTPTIGDLAKALVENN